MRRGYAAFAGVLLLAVLFARAGSGRPANAVELENTLPGTAQFGMQQAPSTLPSRNRTT